MAARSDSVIREINTPLLFDFTSNIAEGSGKRTSIHFAEFLTTALTSAYEMETQLLICERRKYVKEVELKSILNKVEVLQKQISNFRDTILNQK